MNATYLGVKVKKSIFFMHIENIKKSIFIFLGHKSTPYIGDFIHLHQKNSQTFLKIFFPWRSSCR